MLSFTQNLCIPIFKIKLFSTFFSSMQYISNTALGCLRGVKRNIAYKRRHPCFHNIILSLNPANNARIREVQNYLLPKLLAPQLYSRLRGSQLY